MAQLKYCIWVVDDDDGVRGLLRAMIADYGRHANVDEFADGADAWAAWQQQETKPHLLLADMRMTKMQGSELIRRIREQASGLPAVLLSATPANAEFARRLGVEFLAKPYKEEDLFALLRQYDLNNAA